MSLLNLILEQAFAKSFMPVQASTVAGKIDELYKFLVDVSLISCILVIGGMVYFAYKYRRRTDTDKTPYISHNTMLEFLWSFIPFVIFMIVFAWGWIVYHEMRNMPKDALEIHVVGQKWKWNFLYKSGSRSDSELFVPVNTPVKLIMSSRDVIHSFYIPGFRVKQDVVPGRYTALWFEATKTGTFQVFCTEYCGDNHSAMLAKVNVVPKDQFDLWLVENPDPYRGLSMTQMGEKFFKSNCVTCHNTTTERKTGPGLAGVFGREEHFEDGTSLVIDENYLRESILRPANKIVKTYTNQMTSFQGISEEELSGLIEYLKSLKE